MNNNNQNDYKKPLGSRLFILLTVCMIVVAMAVPAFAADPVSYGLSGDWVFNSVLTTPTDWEYQVLNITIDSYSTSYNALRLARNTGSSFPGYYLYGVVLGGSDTWSVYNFTNSQWWISGTDRTFTLGNQTQFVSASFYDWFTQNATPNTQSTNPGQVVLPTDLGDTVSGVLPTVLGWIQQTLNALFVEGGALQGLLLLVAVPVAITLLFLAARFIRNLIWGA